MIHVAVLGFGTVGSGVVETFVKNQGSINQRADQEVAIKYILDRREFPGNPFAHLLTKDFEQILEDDSVQIVVEVMGGLEPAYTFVKKSLLAGKHVVTSNKELVAQHGLELLQIAKDRNINFLFEASVGGGIPIIRPLNQCLTANEITEITGILNGTTNFILTKMDKEGLPYEVVLKEAQELGYAEANPEADVEGHDAGRKIAILSSLAFGRHVDFKNVYTEGITKLQKEDFIFAEALQAKIKLLATSKKVEQEAYARVSPVLISNRHPLAAVESAFNAVFVRGNIVGDVMFYGQGAGKFPTASAVVADIIDAAKHIHRNIIHFWSTEPVQMCSIEEISVSYFVRLQLSDREKAINNCKQIFGEVSFIEVPELPEQIAFITKDDTEANQRKHIQLLNQMEGIAEVKNTIRVEL